MPSTLRSRNAAGAIPPRVFRHRVSEATSYHWRFMPRDGCRLEAPPRRAGTRQSTSAGRVPGMKRPRARRGTQVRHLMAGSMLYRAACMRHRLEESSAFSMHPDIYVWHDLQIPTVLGIPIDPTQDQQSIASIHPELGHAIHQLRSGAFFDEMFEAGASRAPAARALVQLIEALADGELLRRQQSAERALLHMGITFNVYGDGAGTERIFPVRSRPAHRRGRRVELDRARPQAAHPRAEPVHRRHLPRPEDRQGRRRSRPRSSTRRSSFRKQCVGLNPPRGVWCHITGHRPGARPRRADLRARRQPALPVGRVVRAREPRGDEAHVPAGLRVVARSVRSTTIPSRLLRHAGVAGARRRRVAARRRAHARASTTRPTSSTRFLAQQMGVELVEGRDLVVSRRLRLDAHDQGASSGST